MLRLFQGDVQADHQAHINNEDKGPSGLVVIVCLTSLATTTVILRFLARRLTGARLKVDDWTLLLSLVRKSDLHNPLPFFSGELV